MTKRYNYILFLIFVLIIVSGTLDAQNADSKKIEWKRERVAKGVVWKHTHMVFEDTLLQNINMLVINTRKRELSLSYNPAKNIRTGLQAEEAGAIAAVNGGFFNVRDGGSVTYIRMAGMIVDSDTATRWKENANLNGAILVDAGGKVSITKEMPNQWFDSHPEYAYVLVTGPLLIENSKKAVLPESSLVKTRHPRTAMGKTGKHKVVLLTIDGRTSQSAGMSLHELTGFMLRLNCTDAVNLDGGGSTTMWISGKPYGGIVNMPCDNAKFDHEGARAVSNAIIVK